MRVLGIDPGNKNTGFGIIEKVDSRLVPVTYGAVKNLPSLKAAERFRRIYEGLQKVVREFKPDAVACETLFFCKNVKSAIRLGEARGVAILAATTELKEYHEYSPRRVKQAVAGFGGAQKDQVKRMVQKLLGIPTKDLGEDESDALAVAICHLNRTKAAFATHKMSVTGSVG
jgi:crossover junction endodeoxyribonuclease RuvC